VSDQNWLLVAVVLGAAVAAAVVFVVVAMLTRRRNRRRAARDLGNPTLILEEMRKRLEDLPILPRLSTPAKKELPLLRSLDESFTPPEISATALPTRLPKRLSSPPLPTDAEDPITGEPDEAAYRVWLKEWLVYAEQYGDETDSHIAQ